MPDAPFDPRTILDAAATSPKGLTLHFEDADTARAFQVLLSATRRAEQKKLALGVRKWEDMRKLTGWEDIITRTLEGDRLWVGVQKKECFGIDRINGMDKDL